LFVLKFKCRSSSSVMSDAGRIACWPLVSHGEYADRTDRRTERRMPDRYVMLFQPLWNVSAQNEDGVCQFSPSRATKFVAMATSLDRSSPNS